MRRLVGITGLVALVAAIVAALSVAAPTAKTGQEVRLPPKPRLPALPSEIRSRGKFLIGVKCDTPPMGWQDTSGRNRGYDVDVAKQFARWAFGSASRVDFTGVTTASRIGTLTSGRVDMIIATLTWTAEREQTIDYSLPYFGAAGKLLVRNAVTVGRLNSWMPGKRIASTSGSIYDRWVKNCFKQSTFQVSSSPSAGVLAVKNGQVDAMMYDDTFLVSVAANDPDLRLTNHAFLRVPWGIGIRKTTPQIKAWVDAAIRGMKARDMFWPIMKRTIPRRFYPLFSQNAPRPKVNLRYPRGTVPEAACPR
jgi:polar amino acid transport system substrate-binding protein